MNCEISSFTAIEYSLKSSSRIVILKVFFLLFFIMSFQLMSGQAITVWEKRYGNNAEISRDAAIASDGTVLVVGQSCSDSGVVSGHHGEASVADAWVVKLDTAGNLVWQKSIGGSGIDFFNMVFKTETGAYICVGSAQSNDGDLQGNGNVYGAWVVKISGDGDIEWSKTYGGSTCNSAVLMDNGNIGLIVENSSVNRSVLQLDTLGNVLWRSQSNGLAGKFITETNDHKLLTSSGLIFDAVTGDTSRFAGFPVSIPAFEIQALRRLNNRIHIAVAENYTYNKVGYFDTTSGSFIYNIWSTNVSESEYSNNFSLPGNNCLDAFLHGPYIVSGRVAVYTRGGDFYSPVFNTNDVLYGKDNSGSASQTNAVKTFSANNEMLFCGWDWYENMFWIAKLKADGVTVTWIGGENNAWADARNWSNGVVPTKGTKVIIPANALSWPVVNSNAICYSLQVDSGATIIVNPGFNIEITGH